MIRSVPLSPPGSAQGALPREMAKISISNGLTTIDVAILSDSQVDLAAQIAATNRDLAYQEVDGQVHETERSWLDAYCDAHERQYGAAFIAW